MLGESAGNRHQSKGHNSDETAHKHYLFIELGGA